MLRIVEKKKILLMYEEYKKEYGKDNMIKISPKIIREKSPNELAYTNNPELENCIVNNGSVTLFYSKKLFKCPKEYIKAVLYHEFTHIVDCYNFYNFDNSNLIMSTYSEFHAMQVEFLENCNGNIVKIDEKIWGEDGNTTPRKQIEDYLDTILKISKMVKDYGAQVQDKIGMFAEMYIKSYSWMFAYLKFYEKTESEYFEYCFDKLDEYGYKFMAKILYLEIQNLEEIKQNPNRLLGVITKLYELCFGEI